MKRKVESKKRGQTKKNTENPLSQMPIKNAYKKQSNVEQTVKAKTSQPSTAKLGQNKRNTKTQRIKASKRQTEGQNKKMKASICDYKLHMNENAAKKSTNKFCRASVYRACNYLSKVQFLKHEVENRDRIKNRDRISRSRAIETVTKKFQIFTKRIISDMVLSDKELCKKTTLDLVPYYNYYKNILSLISIPDLMLEFHKFCKEKNGNEMDCSESSVVTKKKKEIIDQEIHNIINDIKDFTQHKEEQDKASFSSNFSNVFKVPPQKFLDCMFSENKTIVISQLSEDMFELISNSSFSLLCQVMKNAVSNMRRDFRTKLRIKDFIKGTNLLSGL